MLDTLLGLLDLLTLDRLIFVVMTVGVLFPILGGGVGAVIGAVVDLIKALWLLISGAVGNGEPMPDDWGGAIALVLNAVVFGIIAWVSGQNPADYVFPDDLTQTLLTIASVVSGMAFLIGQFGGSLLSHFMMKKLVPKAASSSTLRMHREARRTTARA